MKRIAILGGGVGAISAAFELTSQPGWEKRYSVTVYQRGWRLGGKGASGRGPYNRIEEHGLHIWFAAYVNAFDMLRRCYEELEQAGERLPVKSFEEAFVAQDNLVVQENLGGQWRPWVFTFGESGAARPGAGPNKEVNAWLGMLNLLSWLHRQSESNSNNRALQAPVESLRHANTMARRLHTLGPGRNFARAGAIHKPLVSHLDAANQSIQAQLDSTTNMSDDERRFSIVINMGISIVRGLIADGAVVHGYDVLDGQDLRQWLRKHGALPQTLSSPLLRALYDLAFSYPRGETLSNPDTPAGDLAAGVGVRAMLGMFAYENPIMWKLRSSMGETIFTPLYLALRRRNVRFKFFHRVARLYPSSDGKVIERVDLRRQAMLASGDEYDPLEPKYLSWPNMPRVDLLAPADRPTAAELESSWGPEGEEIEPLLYRRDFDTLVLGIPVGALRDICSELTSVNTTAGKRWKSMLCDVQSVRTQAVQLWFASPLDKLGWAANAPAPVLGGYGEPLGTWADMSHLIPTEQWPESATPATSAYLCGVMPDDPYQPEAFTDPSYPARQAALVKANARQFLELNAAGLWPSTTAAGRFEWSSLVDPKNGKDQERLDAQFWRANIDPGEQYVPAFAGTTNSRLRSDKSGFSNLLLAGDWTWTELNCGCVEAAVMSARHAVRTIVGKHNLPILGPFHHTSLQERLARVVFRASQSVRHVFDVRG